MGVAISVLNVKLRLRLSVNQPKLTELSSKTKEKRSAPAFPLNIHTDD